MTQTRRNILAGLLVSMAAPAIIRTPEFLMPVRARLADTSDVREWLRLNTLRKHDAAVREIRRLRERSEALL